MTERFRAATCTRFAAAGWLPHRGRGNGPNSKPWSSCNLDGRISRASTVLSAVSVSELASDAGGDLMATPASRLALATLLVGTLALLVLETVHALGRRARRSAIPTV
jgi:hypothetical protein